MNRCVIIGNLCSDPTLKTTTSGKSVCNFTIAVKRRFKKDEADFIPIVVWEKQAENCAKYLRKGSQCAVSGAIQTRNYEAKDGSKRYITEIIADEVEFLTRASDNANRQAQPSNKQEDMTEITEDLPF